MKTGETPQERLTTVWPNDNSIYIRNPDETVRAMC